MKSISLLFAAGGVAISSVAHASSPQKLDEQKPNILLIMVDDLGLGDLSCQYARDLQTPNIDKLFSDGVRLNNFYANSSVSSPSRAGCSLVVILIWLEFPVLFVRNQQQAGDTYLLRLHYYLK